MDANERRARELLAAEYERDEFDIVQARQIREGYVNNTTATALRAIMAALAQQPVQGEAVLSPNSMVWTSLDILLTAGQQLKDRAPLLAADIIGQVQSLVAYLEPLTQPPAPAVGDGALAYAKRLARFMWSEHYASESPDWEPCPDLMGVLSQIDNMLTGLARKPDDTPVVQIAAPGDVEREAVTLEQFIIDNIDAQRLFWMLRDNVKGSDFRAALEGMLSAYAALRSQGQAEAKR